MLRQGLSCQSHGDPCRASPTTRTFLGFWALSCILQNSFPCCSSDFSLVFILPLLKLQPEHLMLNKLSHFQTFSFNCPLSDLTARRFQCRIHQSRFPLLWLFSTELGRHFLGCQTFPEHPGAILHLPGSTKYQRGNVGTSTPNRNWGPGEAAPQTAPDHWV